MEVCISPTRRLQFDRHFATLVFSIDTELMKTRSVANLGTIDGREAYRSYWRDLVIDRRTPIIPSLFHLWQTARRGGSFDIVSRDEAVSVAHPLGLRSGTRLFMEEIVVRRYFNNVQALVYLGAVVLLIFLALRFAGALSEEVALIGVGIEVLMLLMLFAVLFYSPEEVAEATESTFAKRGLSKIQVHHSPN